MARIILLRYEECGIFDWTYEKEPLPVELDIADEIINNVLDAAVEAAINEKLIDGTGSTEDLAYDNAIFHVTEAINKLREEK
jgi:hypothetical protein